MTLLIGTKGLNIIKNDVGPQGWCDAIYCVRHYVISRSTLLYYVLESQQVFTTVIYSYYYIKDTSESRSGISGKF
jgi:hypothetical protein